MNATAFTLLVLALSASGQLWIPNPLAMPAAVQQSAQSATTRKVGAIKAINGTTITLAVDSDGEVDVVVAATTRILRLEAGKTNLKDSTPAQLSDLQVGDRMLVGGTPSEDAKSVGALTIIVMKRSDLEAHQAQEMQDWQKRGVDGLVKSLDPSSGTIVLSVPSFGGAKEISVHTSKETVILRYPPGSANFADAKRGSFQEIQPGDQLRARGNRSADGAELTADEIVSGTFRNIAGTVASVDASTGTISVQDLLSKKPVQVKVNSDSLLRRLPPEAARLVMGFKGGSPGGPAGSGANSSAGSSGGEGRAPAASPGGMGPGVSGAPGGPGGGRTFDLNRVVSRMPAISVGDLHKGDVVMIVATEGPGGDVVTKLLSGVEPILQAAPSASQALMMAPWSLSAPSGDNGNP
jgi:hypothetical protein